MKKRAISRAVQTQLDEFADISKKSLCFVIVTANRAEAIDGNLIQCAEEFFNCGIDVYVYDSSDNDKTKDIVEWYSQKFNNVKYLRWNGKYDGVSIDNKVIDAYTYFSDKYDYVWLSQEGICFKAQTVLDGISNFIKDKTDIICINDVIRDTSFIGTKSYDDIGLFFRDNFIEMNTLGFTIVKSTFIQKVIETEPLNEKNYALWQPVAFFVYATKQKVSCVHFVGNILVGNKKSKASHFWMKNLFYQWCDRWLNFIDYLPEYYNQYKECIKKPSASDFSPFSTKHLFLARQEDYLRIKDIYIHRKRINLVTDTPLWKFYVIALMPKFMVKILSRHVSHINKKTRYLSWLELNCSHPIKNYEKIVDAFEFTKDVTSTKLYENNKIKDPFITICIPTYKRTEMLKEAMNSVLNQRKVNFAWDILVVDNEPCDGKSNDTEKYIRSLKLNNITYYRNSQNIRPGDNFNRCILLAKAPWIMMLHDDDLLTADALVNMGKSIDFLSTQRGKPLGAIAASYYQFQYDERNPQKSQNEIKYVEKEHLSNFQLYKYIKLTHSNILCTGHIGGSVPSNGAIYNREAVIVTGGFNEDNGISGDLILYYDMENRYSVYQNMDITGYYRWGNNSMSLPISSYRTIRDGYLFREYVFSKSLLNRIYGFFFRSALYYTFTGMVIEQRKKAFSDYVDYVNYAGVYNIKPNKLAYKIFKKIRKIYGKIKHIQMKRLQHKAKKYFKNNK